MLKGHCKDCSLINGAQNLKVEKGFVEFRNYSKQIPAPFKIYADFECLLKSCDSGVHNDYLVILPNIKTMYLVVLLIN